jgi:amino acid adenylation domain-containing protein
MLGAGLFLDDIGENRTTRVSLKRGDCSMSYRELNERADQLATRLVDTGATAGSAVAICVERSFDWVVAALGIWRAGAAYVPLDIGWPLERMRFVVRDSGATHVVGNSENEKKLGVSAIWVDPVRDTGAMGLDRGGSRMEPNPESLAYIIYTSGSSGYPKGVEITHSNLDHLVRWHRKAFQVSENDRASHLAGLGFDAAGWEIWPYLASGAEVSLVDEVTRTSAELLQRWMVEERITIGFVPTALATSMMEMSWPRETSLRVLLTGGEKLHRRPRSGLPFSLVNNYGPTECTVVATSGLVEPGETAPTIGRPIHGAEVLIVDADGSVLEHGNRGEIWIGGDGVGLGYRNLSELTAQQFVADPRADRRGRMYRTGDLGVLLANGEIEFCGRIDSQEKIRGQRIELEEISSVLYRHPMVKFATVATIEDGAGDKQLVAYVLPTEEQELTSNELRDYLARSVPGVMIPSMFVRLRALPLTLNGKVDRRALEFPSEENQLPAAMSDAPHSSIAEVVLGIVRELLKSDAVGVDDDFFLAGGHSLLGTQLTLRVRDRFQVDLMLRDLFEARNVKRLAMKIEEMLIDEVDAMSEEEALRAVESSL